MTKEIRCIRDKRSPQKYEVKVKYEIKSGPYF